MQQRNKKIIAFALSLAFVGLGILSSTHAFAATTPPTDFGLGKTAEYAGIPGATSTTPIGPAALIGTIIGYVLAFVGVIFFGIMVYGGFLWMTARGAGDQVKKAKDMIEQAAIGIVIVFISYVVTNFVLKTLLSGVTGQ